MKQLFYLLTLLFFANTLQASTGDTIRVMTHDTVLIQTDPGGSGHTEYARWGVFPSAATKYSKVMLRMKFACPNLTGLTCGEWDYLNWIYVRRTGSQADTSKNVSIATFITPYGHYWPKTWNFEWMMDVTDYSLLLHDSVEIEYDHTGFEASNDRGWRVTLEFICIEGTPALEPVKIENLYNGSAGYGGTPSIDETFLTERSVTSAPDAHLLRFRLNQTGHGNDSPDGCGEFCSKSRTIWWDSTFIEQDQVWRTCGDNPLFPQYGTWLFDRANWCPGAPVRPSIYDWAVEPNTPHKVNVDMESYNGNGGGNYMFTSQVIHYKANNYQNDIELYDILTPNDRDESNRMSPICANPKVVIKNNGANTLTACEIKYGIEGDNVYTYFWSGQLKSGQTREVDLPSMFYRHNAISQTFTAWVDYPNGGADEYHWNDTSRTHMTAPPLLDSTFIAIIKTTSAAQDTRWKIYDSNGNVVDSNDVSNYSGLAVYRDTVHLTTGCYELVLSDETGDGLDFNWVNGLGVGYFKLVKLNNQVIKNFTADFGNSHHYQFVVGTPDVDQPTAVNEVPVDPFFEVYPNPTANLLKVDLALPVTETITVTVTNLTGERIAVQQHNNFSNGILQFDFNTQPQGLYFVTVQSATQKLVKKVIVAR